MRRAALTFAWLVLSMSLCAALHLHRTASHALAQSEAAHARGEFLLAVLFAEEAAKCAPIPPSSEARDALLAYATEAAKNRDAPGTAFAWQAYERVVQSARNVDAAEAARAREGLLHARELSLPSDAPAPPKMPPPVGHRESTMSMLLALAMMSFGVAFVRRPNKSFAAGVVACGALFAGLSYLV